MQMLQQPHQITILYDYSYQVRHVRMNRPHPAQLTPSWYGDSVGHYEGDTLVIDTVGIKSARPFAMVDMYGTPYTDALHVVERYRLLDYESAKEHDVNGVGKWKLDHFHGQRTRRLLHYREGVVRGGLGLVHGRNPLDSGRGLLEQFKPFAGERIKHGDPGGIALRTSNIFNNAVGEDVTGRREDNRNGLCLLLQRPCRRPANGEDHLGSKAHQLRRVGADTVGIGAA